MQKQVQLPTQLLSYTLRVSSRTRSLRLSVHRDGRVVATAPLLMPSFLVDRFIRQKSGWVLEKLAHFKNMPSPIVPRSTKKDFLQYKSAALVLAKERVEHFNRIYQFSFKKIAIRNQKTRWGSCSKKGNLNFSYRIALLPPTLADYLVVHELCHLGEFNHSCAFWNLVSRTIPDYKELRKELKRS